MIMLCVMVVVRSDACVPQIDVFKKDFLGDWRDVQLCCSA